MHHSGRAAVSDHDFCAAFATPGSHILDLLDDIVALDDLAKNNMLVIEMRGLAGAHEELAAVGVGPSVGHGQASFTCVLARLASEAFIFKLVSVNRLSTSAVVVGEVAALAHEAWDHTVEARALVAKALLSSAKSTEVFGCFRHIICVELEGHPACRGTTNSHVKEDPWI